MAVSFPSAAQLEYRWRPAWVAKMALDPEPGPQPDPLPETTASELARLDDINIVLPQTIELVALNDTATILMGTGRITDAKLITPQQIAFSFVATTEAGVALIDALQDGRGKIIPLVKTLPNGGLRVNMQFQIDGKEA